MRIPKKLGACADLLYDLRAEKAELSRQIREIESVEKEVKEYIINNLPKSDLTGVSGAKARVSVVSKEIPVVTSWEDLYEYIQETSNFHILGRRIIDKAVREIQETEEVPGIGSFNVISVSCTKV